MSQKKNNEKFNRDAYQFIPRIAITEADNKQAVFHVIHIIMLNQIMLKFLGIIGPVRT
jgi:hypothetical protein